MHFSTPTALILNANHEDSNHFVGVLKVKGFWVKSARTIEDAKHWLDNNDPTLALIALDMNDGDSLELFDHPSLQSNTEIILTSHSNDIERVRKGISAGASCYFHCPSDERFLMALLNDIVAEVTPSHAGKDSLSNVTPIDQFGLLRGRSLPMRNLYRTIRRVAPKDVSVFIFGESGTGKELVAQTINLFSERRDNPFIALNCGAIPKDLIESELFGHEKGSFSGADKRHVGFFERADTGTLFLDEVTEMPVDLQIKLLRVLESGRFRPIGAESDKVSDVRILAASNRDPDEAVEDGSLREDLYYRIAGFPIYLQPLRERGDDLKGLVQYFLSQLNDENSTVKNISPDALAQLQSYHWPGNVRELRSVIDQAYIMANSEITSADLPVLEQQKPEGKPPVRDDYTITFEIGQSLQSVEKELILATLDKYQGKKTRCAKALGISLKTLYNRLNSYEEERVKRMS